MPSVDDGPATVEESLALADLYQEQGIERAFCTPHYRSPHFHVGVDDARDAFALLQSQRAQKQAAPGRGLNLVVGAEVHLALDLADDIRSDSVPTLGDTRYVLVEFPNDDLPEHSLRWIHELVVRGYTPIMAHPERHLIIRKDPRRMEELMEQGVLMQLTAMCFVPQGPSPTHSSARSDVRRQSDQMAWDILSRGQAAIIASDAHSTTRRPPKLGSAYEAIADRFGYPVVETLMGNANAVWDGRPTERVVPPAPSQKRWFSLRRN